MYINSDAFIYPKWGRVPRACHTSCHFRCVDAASCELMSDPVIGNVTPTHNTPQVHIKVAGFSLANNNLFVATY
jgi:hypothetical protein